MATENGSNHGNTVVALAPWLAILLALVGFVISLPNAREMERVQQELEARRPLLGQVTDLQRSVADLQAQVDRRMRETNDQIKLILARQIKNQERISKQEEKTTSRPAIIARLATLEAECKPLPAHGAPP